MSRQSQHIRRGVSWNAFGMVFSKTASLIAKLLLARLLVPADFGLVSMVIVFVLVLKIFADLGFRNSVIYRRRDTATKRLYDTAFWLLTMFASLAVLAMFGLGAEAIARFYGAPQLQLVAAALSLSILIQNLQMVPEIRLTRSLKFGRIALSELGGTLIGCACALALASKGAGVWSLVAQVLIADTVTAGAFFACAHWRPKLRFDFRLLGKMRAYNSYIVGSRVLQYVEQNLDYLLLGKLMGAHALGVYSLAFLATETLRAQIYWVIGKVAFPIYSRIVSDKARVRTVYLTTVRYISLAVFPISVGLILFAGHIVPALLSPAWTEAVAPIQILAVASMVSASAGTPTEALRGLGRADTDFAIHLQVTFLIALPALWVGITLWGLVGAAWAVLAYYLCSRFLSHAALRRELSLKWIDVGRATAPAMAGAIAMMVSTLALEFDFWVTQAVASAVAYLLAVGAMLKWRVFGQGQGFTDLGASPRAAPKPVMIILGPDGSGKSTLVSKLSAALPGMSESLYLGMSLETPWVFAIARSSYRNHLRQAPGMMRDLTGFAVWYVFVPIEFVARRLKAGGGRQTKFVIIDRVPSRPFLRGGLLGAFYRRIVPTPSSAVLLIGDAREIAGRKEQETDFARTVLDMAKWEQVALQISPNSVIRLDTTQRDANSCTAFLMEVLDAASAKRLAT